MALVPIPINKGGFEAVDAFELGNPEFASRLRNALINDAGSNVARPGLSEFASTGSYGLIGAAFFSDHIVVVNDDRKIFSINEDGIVANITGTSLGGTLRPTFATDGTYLAIAGGGTPQRWSGTGNTAAMPGSPPNCSHISYLDGYWIVHLLNDQEFRWAGPTSSARESWSSANFFQAEGLPDNIVSQAVLLRELYAFGSQSTETFFNYGDSVVPFKRQFFLERGVIAPYSVVTADNRLWWLDASRRFVVQENKTPVLVSTPYDRVIKRLNTVSDCWGAVIDIDGFYLIAWTFPTEERTFVYDYKNQYWSEWDSLKNGLSSRMRMHCYVHAKDWNKHFVGDPVDGVLWELSRSNYSDGDRPRRVMRRTGQIDHGTGNRKRSNYYLFDVKRAVGTGSSSPLMEIRVNDDGQGWSDPEQVELGVTGDPQEPIRVDMRGIYRKRQIEVTCTDSVEFVLHSIFEDVEVMTS